MNYRQWKKNYKKKHGCNPLSKKIEIGIARVLKFQMQKIVWMENSMSKVPKEKLTCKYCSYCMCSENDNGGAYCYVDIHDYIPDINSGNICSEFAYDDTFERNIDELEEG